MNFELRSYSKEQQLGNKQKKPKKKHKNPLKPEVYKGRAIPKKQVRGRISAQEYNEALRRHGEQCEVCGISTGLEAHHIRFRSSGGRGRWRNIRFLCGDHHRGPYSPHQNEGLRKELEELHFSLYGQYFACDKYDLFKLGLLPNTDDNAFEEFMKGEEECAASRISEEKI